MAAVDLTAARLRDLLEYHPSTGVFIWLVSPSRRVKPGQVAGWVDDGYQRIRVDGCPHLAHRLAWLHEHGKWPEFTIDHINGDKLDNRIANLRDVPIATNNQNCTKPRRDSVIGIKGVKAVGKVFQARIRFNGEQHYLGRFKTVEDASSAYLAAKRRLQPGFAG